MTLAVAAARKIPLGLSGWTPLGTQVCARTIQALADATGLSIEQLVGDSRSLAIARVRQAGYWLAYRMGATLVQVGEAFGSRDHSTVLYGIRVTEKRRAADPKVADWLQTMTDILRG